MQKSENFSLVLKHAEYMQRIDIPLMPTKRLTEKTAGGKKTYQMAIDAFTTQFSNQDELLDYIRQNKLARIKNVNNGDLSLTIEYNGEKDFNGNLDIVYNDNQLLLDFIQAYPICDTFNAYREIDTSIVRQFQNETIYEMFNGTYHTVYSQFMTHKNKYYDTDLTNALYEHYNDEQLKDPNAFIAPFYRYHNIRGYCILKTEDTIETQLKRMIYNSIHYQEKSLPENIEFLREIEEEERIQKTEKTKKTL